MAQCQIRTSRPPMLAAIWRDYVVSTIPRRTHQQRFAPHDTVVMVQQSDIVGSPVLRLSLRTTIVSTDFNGQRTA